MTAADFIAACFWPFVVLATLALLKARKTAAFPFVLKIVTAFGLAYFVLVLFFDKSSVIAVNDMHAILVLFGLAVVGSQLRVPAPRGSWRDKAKGFGAMIAIVLFGRPHCMVLRTHARPRFHDVPACDRRPGPACGEVKWPQGGLSRHRRGPDGEGDDADLRAIAEIQAGGPRRGWTRIELRL
ncbi:hypothetical protein ABIF93_009141 [Bradyrhizobium japonicum]